LGGGKISSSVQPVDLYYYLDIQPYQFEPLCNDESQQEREHSTSEDSDIDESSQGQLKTDMSKGEVLIKTMLIVYLMIKSNKIEKFIFCVIGPLI
jgi:hypothetical protein